MVWLYLWLLAVPATVLIAVPALDQWVARLFADGATFPFEHSWFTVVMYYSIRALSVLFFGTVVTAAVWCARTKRKFYGLRPRAANYLFLVALVAPCLLANYAVKEIWNRPRPRETLEFGGHLEFSRVLVPQEPDDEDAHSFVSGHAAVGFFPLALCPLIPCCRRRRRFAAGILAFGYVIGMGRMIQGAHWASDIVFSGVLTVLVAHTIHYMLFRLWPAPTPPPSPMPQTTS